ncbi:MAG: response regulator [Candidatus Coatesbacteria bacterium]
MPKDRSVKKRAVTDGGTSSERTPQHVSTLEAARILGVSTFSVQRWFDEGLLSGARLPGGKRRIAAESLRRFMQEHGILPAHAEAPDRLRVLIVEDDARLLEVMKDVLTETGEFLVQTATGGLDAGLAIAEFNPDAVVLDVMLEDVPGSAVVRRLRQSSLGRSVRIIAISGRASPEDVAEIKAAGADIFLAKPFEPRDLLKALRPTTRA